MAKQQARRGESPLPAATVVVRAGLLEPDSLAESANRNFDVGEKIAHSFREPAGKVEPLEVLPVAGDEPRRVPRREPHPLLLVELRVGDRPEMLQRGDDRG